MRAITLIRPMAAAIIHGTKRIENRPRDLPKSMRGVPTIVAVHAGKGWDEQYALTVQQIDDRGDVVPYHEHLRDEGLIGLMRLTGRVFTNTWNVRERHDGDSRWFSGPFGYEIDRVVVFASPIPCRGMLGWWTPPDDVVAQVKNQLAKKPDWRMYHDWTGEPWPCPECGSGELCRSDCTVAPWNI